jgi:hypothetical protein
VACGARRCTPDETCCIDTVNDPRCIPALDVCLGVAARCDGVEDCQAGLTCCEAGSTLVCSDSCAVSACQEPADCPSEAPNCCVDDTIPGQTWKTCQFDPC